MVISIIGLILFVGLVGITLLGGCLRRIVPAEHLNPDSKDVVKLALGLVATMTAILLGQYSLALSQRAAFGLPRRSEVVPMAAKVGWRS